MPGQAPLRRLLAVAKGGGSFVPLPRSYAMLYNGHTGNGIHKIGLATSSDGGQTWTRYAGNPVLSNGSAGSWEDEQVHAPQVVWDGSQWVMYYDGYDGAHYRIGRATSADLITWSKYGSNPVLGLGGSSDPDKEQAIAPMPLYIAGDARPWKMWYTGADFDHVYRLCFADSVNGLSWTKRGVVIGIGPGGAFDHYGASSDVAVKVGATYYVAYAGQASPTNHTRPGWYTCTDPADAGTYVQQGEFIGLDQNITLDNGITYVSNGITSVERRGDVWVAYGTCINPTSGITAVCWRSTSADFTTWVTPTTILLPLAAGTFDTVAAENASVVVAA